MGRGGTRLANARESSRERKGNQVALKPADPQAIVIFGASGDLTRRKLLPAFWHLFVEGLLPQGIAIVGLARIEMNDDQWKEYAHQQVKQFAREEPAGEQWDEFAKRLSYITGEFASDSAMEQLRERLEWCDENMGTSGGRFYYCATPPSAYPDIVRSLGKSNLHSDAKIVIEKPFGRDLETAKDLNEILHSVFDESQIFRIDHYLGKETVQNLLALRFANGMFEPIWNRRYVDNVQITVAEEIGIEGRGAFYEQTGTIRDMLVTHLFQVLTVLAMEPPVSFDPDRLRDEKVRVLRAMQPVDPGRVVRGQFIGYRQEQDVAPDSQAETFAAVQVFVDNWRWAGVPFNLRTGKYLARKVTELSLSFRQVPYSVFKGTEAVPPGRDALVIRVQPNEGISLHLNIKKPGIGFELDRAVLDFDYDSAYHTPLIEAYETLILEAMGGDHTLFTRSDEVERAWEVIAPVLENPPPVHFYDPGSWGPVEADEMILPRHWHVMLPPQARGR
jgi:glucose-6-phosphate 1-dehydrogenase